MSIIKILNDKNESSEAKLAAVKEIVAEARSKYGNEDATIPTTAVNTIYGSVDFEHLEDDSKVEVIKGEVQKIKTLAVEASKTTAGTNINKEIEKLIATNSFLNNVVAKAKFDYL